MSDGTNIKEDMAATGLPPYSIKSKRGGDDRDGVAFGQTRPTGILATGKAKRTSIDRVGKRDGGSR